MHVAELMVLTVMVASGASAFSQRAQQQVCYQDLGCFGTSEHMRELPLPPEQMGTQFLLYTRGNLNESVVINATDMDNWASLLSTSLFSADKATKVIIHGYTQSANADWVQQMKADLLEKGDFNVIAVNWHSGASKLVNKAAANVFLVAKQLAKFFSLLAANNYDLTQMHLIGHSFGAHVAGNAASAITGNVARITGLDPAEPFFISMGNSFRLDKSDAQFVDVIHSDAESFQVFKGFGLMAALAHADFYPNGGIDQPGCSDSIGSGILGLISGQKNRSLGCSHSRATDLFLESINPITSCRFTAHPCSNWTLYNAGNCNSCPPQGCPTMGYNVDTSARGSFYLATADNSPFCGHEYLVQVDLTNRSDENSYGRFFITLQGGQDSEEKEFSRDAVHYHGGNIETQLIAFHTTVGEVTGVKVKFRHEDSFFGSSSSDRTVYLHKVTVQDMATGHSNQFCAGDVQLAHNQAWAFTTQTGC